MTKYFMRDTPLAGLERLMMTPPNFQARGGGKQAPYQYTAADCDCRYCLKAEKEKTHRRRMIATTMMGREPAPYLAVVFLLSADSALWRKSSKALRTGSANLYRITDRGLDPTGRVLLEVAKDLHQCKCSITVNELCDPMRIGDELLRLLISALVIRGYGLPSERLRREGYSE